MDKISPEVPREAPEFSNPSDPQGEVPSVAKMKLQEFLGIPNTDSKHDQSLNEMVRVLDGDAKDPIDFLWEIKQIENRIGTPPLGMTRIQHLYNFVKLNAQMSRIRKEMEVYGP